MRDHGKVMLVGSVARLHDNWTAEHVLRTCAKYMNGHVSMLPDGEVGDRVHYIQFIPYRTYSDNPDMITTSRHTKEHWWNTRYDDHWQFTLRPGVKELHFDTLHYAEEAINSYKTFTRLRDEGVIPKGVRFQVCLPITEDGARPFIDTPRHYEILAHAYEEAMKRDLERILAAIPHNDLAIQWDGAVATLAIEGILQGMGGFKDEYETLPNDPVERWSQSVRNLTRGVIPDDVWLGLHICYGSLGHEEGSTSDSAHACEIKDLDVSVRMANAGAEGAGRRVDFVHFAVPKEKGLTDAYYKALGNLKIKDAHVYLGLIHLSDGVEGALKRMAVARKFIKDFGVATECGWGRRPASQKVEDILQVERDIATHWPQ